MAQPQLDFFRKRGLALKLRAVADTPVVPTSALNAIMLFDGTSGTETDNIERNIDRVVLGHVPFVVGNKRAFIEGDFELFPPATPGQVATSDAACGPLLLPAGFSVAKDDEAKTTRYNPISAAMPISDAYWWHSGTELKVAAARHNVTQLGLTIGDRFKGHIRVQGDYTTVLETALPTDFAFDPTLPVVATYANTTCQIDTGADGSPLTVWAKSLLMDLGNTITQKEYSSHKETGVSDRRPTWTLRIARTALADFNPWAVRDAGTVVAVTMRQLVTTPTGLYTELGVRGQIEGINPVEIDGDYGWELTGRAIPSDAGGDECYVEFGDTTA